MNRRHLARAEPAAALPHAVIDQVLAHALQLERQRVQQLEQQVATLRNALLVALEQGPRRRR